MIIVISSEIILTMNGVSMDKSIYKPDLTISNARKAMLTNTRKKELILTCRNCRQGVTPKGKRYLRVAAMSTGIALSLIFHLVLDWLSKYVSNYSRLMQLTFSAIFTIGVLYYLVCPPIYLFSFRFTAWVPAWRSENQEKAAYE